MIRTVYISCFPWKQWGRFVNRSLYSVYSHRRYSSCNPDLKINGQATIYVHWPYCSKICTYCNFNKYVSKNVEENRMLNCLIRETETLLKISGVKQVNSVFFGGGTPSLLDPKVIQSYLDCVSKNVYLPPDSEVSLEMNPLEMSKLRDFKASGITRVSVGVQALNNEDLLMLGREHSVDEAIRCVAEAKTWFPGKISIDLIFGRPKQTVKTWIEEIQNALSFCDDHVSLYQLTVERGTKLFQWVKEAKVDMPDNDTMADLYKTAIEVLEESCFKQYEVANFAKQGAESSHNQSYWTGMQYLGIGPGAHGRFTPVDKTQREARVQTLDPKSWMIEVEKFGHGTRKIQAQTTLEQLQELIIVGMRMTKGIETSLWSRHCDTHSLMDVFEGSPDIQNLIDMDLIELDEGGIKATSNGIMVLDSVTPYLIEVLTGKLEQQSCVSS